MKFCFALLTVLSCFYARAETLKASIFEIGKTSGTPRFIQESERRRTADLIQWSSTIKTSNGELVMTEKAAFRADGVIQHHYIEQLQINEAYELNVRNSMVKFTTYKLNQGIKGSTVSESSELTKPNSFIMGPTTEIFLTQNLENLGAGETIKADFGIFELSKFIRFKFYKTSQADELLIFHMKPSNIFFSALVDPIVIWFDPNRKRISRLKGRTPLREKINEKWKPFDAEIIYH